MVLVTIAAMLPTQRSIAFVSGGLLTVATPLAVSYGDYWSPERLGGLPLGPADFLYAFSAGLITWLFVLTTPLARGMVWQWQPWSILRRMLPFFLVVPIGHFGLVEAGVDSMTTSLIGLVGAAAALLALRPSLWPLSLSALLIYPVVHGLSLALAFRIWPRLPSYWHTDTVWGQPAFLGVPAGEFAFHAALGAAWPIMAVYFLDARPERSRSQDTGAARKN